MSDESRKARILVVDDEPAVREQLTEILQDEGYDVVGVGSGEEGVEQAGKELPDAIFLDVWLPGMDGIETLRALRERGIAAPVIMISGHGTIDTAVRATKLGAYDFVEKPMSLERILLVTANSLRQARLERRNRALRTELRREAEFLGKSDAVETLRAHLAEATDGGPVLLYGEKGTGRRLAARWLALHGARPDGPFLDVQVSAFSRERLIRTLFGTSADPGRLPLADEGTLYMENGDTLPAALQSSLAMGIRSGAYPVPGSRREIRCDPILVVALLEPPEILVEAGKLSADFLSSFKHTIEIPSLRARAEDIAPLAARFLGEMCREYAREELRLSEAALHILKCYSWPGNVRELKRVVERLVLLAVGPEIVPDELPTHVTGRAGTAAGPETGTEAEMAADPLGQFEEGWIRRQIAESRGDIARAAARLGVNEGQLRARMKDLGID